MNRNLFVILSFCILFVTSCSKRDNNSIVSEPTIEGNWKMELYIDSSIGLTETKEQSYLNPNFFMGTTPYPPVGDVKMKITFTNSNRDSGLIEGNTIFNVFKINFAVASPNHFKYINGLWTLSADPPWGMYFSNCIEPAKMYSFDDQLRLRIHSSTKTLVFARD